MAHESIMGWSSIITRNNRANTCSPPFPLTEGLPLLRVGLELGGKNDGLVGGIDGNLED